MVLDEVWAQRVLAQRALQSLCNIGLKIRDKDRVRTCCDFLILDIDVVALRDGRMPAGRQGSASGRATPRSRASFQFSKESRCWPLCASAA